MAASLYSQSIPVLIKHMKNLSGYLTKGLAYAEQQKMKHEYMINYRLIHDMRGLAYQVQSCSNTAKFLPFRLGLVDKDTYFPDDESTFEELQARITTTIQLLESIDEKAMDALEAKPVTMATRTMGTYKFASPQTYIADYAMPNFYFHVTSAYCILRTLGVPVSAMDFHGKETFVKVEE